MNFQFDKKRAHWTASASLRGRDIELIVDGCYPAEEVAQLGSDALKRVDDDWGRIEDNLVDSLLETHNDSWADPEEGFPELGRGAFLAKITLEQIQLMEDDAITLYFGDSEIFGGHLVDVFWTTEKMYPASLAG